MPAGSPYLRVSYGEKTAVLTEPYQRVLVALAVVALLAFPLAGSAYYLHLLNLAFLAVIGAVGLNLLTGYCGQISLGHAAFLGIGAFTTAALAPHGVPFWIAIPLSAAVGGLIGLAVGIPALRFRGIYLAIATLAMHYAIVFGLTSFQATFGGSASGGITIPPPALGGFAIDGEWRWYYTLLAAASAVVWLGINLARSYVGRAWTAIRDRDIAAAAMGIDVARFKVFAFVVSSGLAALAGSLSAYFTGVVSADGFTLELAILYLAMIIVGGMGSILGSIFGAAFMTLLPFAIDRAFHAFPNASSFGTAVYGIQEAAVGVVIIGFLLIEPKGLAEIYRRTATYFERWPFRYRELQPSARR